MPIPLRSDFDGAALRRIARGSKDGPQARRLLALAAIYEGASRTEAARIGGVTLQIVPLAQGRGRSGPADCGRASGLARGAGLEARARATTGHRPCRAEQGSGDRTRPVVGFWRT